MKKRAAAVAQTRQRIIAAARELHGERGIAATSWDDIAARAGVGVGTVYRHFPSLDELIPACGAITMQVIALPDPASVPALFERAAEPAERPTVPPPHVVPPEDAAEIVRRHGMELLGG